MRACARYPRPILVLPLRRDPYAPPPEAGDARAFAKELSANWTANAAWTTSAAALADLGALAEELLSLAEACAGEVLADDHRLARLDVSGPAADAMRRSWARRDPALIARLDLALEPLGQDRYRPRLLEINADTPGSLVEGALLQPAWGRAAGRPTAGDALAAHLSAALEALPAPRYVLHHPGDPYIAATARYLASLAPGTQRVEWPAVPPPDAASVYKIFRWGRLWAGRFAEVSAWAADFGGLLAEPPWRGLVQHKGLLAELWRAHPAHPALLPTVLDGPEHLPDAGAGGFAQKSFHGVGGAEVTLVTADGTHGPLEPAGGPSVWQSLCLGPCIDERYPILSAYVIGGRCAGALIREDTSRLSSDDRGVPLATDG